MAQLSFLKTRSGIVLSAFLIVQCSLFYGFSRGEAPAVHKPLEGFPTEIGGWRMIQQGVIEQEIKDVLRADDYITRYYEASPTKFADLFVAFFQTQRAGQTPHSPKNCLPGSGWVWPVSDAIPVNLPGHAAPTPPNLYSISKTTYPPPALYWYHSPPL